jgi:hypothetical protein
VSNVEVVAEPTSPDWPEDTVIREHAAPLLSAGEQFLNADALTSLMSRLGIGNEQRAAFADHLRTLSLLPAEDQPQHEPAVPAEDPARKPKKGSAFIKALIILAGIAACMLIPQDSDRWSLSSIKLPSWFEATPETSAEQPKPVPKSAPSTAQTPSLAIPTVPNSSAPLPPVTRPVLNTGTPPVPRLPVTSSEEVARPQSPSIAPPAPTAEKQQPTTKTETAEAPPRQKPLIAPAPTVSQPVPPASPPPAVEPPVAKKAEIHEDKEAQALKAWREEKKHDAEATLGIPVFREALKPTSAEKRWTLVEARALAGKLESPYRGRFELHAEESYPAFMAWAKKFYPEFKDSVNPVWVQDWLRYRDLIGAGVSDELFVPAPSPHPDPDAKTQTAPDPAAAIAEIEKSLPADLWKKNQEVFLHELKEVLKQLGAEEKTGG